MNFHYIDMKFNLPINVVLMVQSMHFMDDYDESRPLGVIPRTNVYYATKKST